MRREVTGVRYRSKRLGLRRARERGAALVEFAFVFPLLAMILFGTITGGFALNEKQQMTHATREGVRYAATVPYDQPFTSGTWATNVRDMVVERSAGTLRAADVCVSLVHNPPSSTVGRVFTTATRAATYYSTSGAPCIANQTFPVTEEDRGRRVQITVRRAVTVSWVLGTSDVVLKSDATSRTEDKKA
jgi:Flp pilus assembly protein TadG